MGYAKKKLGTAHAASAAAQPPSPAPQPSANGRADGASSSVWNIQIGGAKRKTEMKSVEVLLFTSELADLIEAGMTLGQALKALAAPFPQIKFIPTGGVDRSNIDEFLAFDKVAAIGGSFFVKESLEKMEAEK